MLALMLGLSAGSALPASAQVDDHLLCFKVKDPLKLAGVVDLVLPSDVQAFVDDGRCFLSTPKEYCVPVTAAVVEAEDRATKQPIDLLPIDGPPGPNDRVCYKLKCRAGSDAGREASDRFGTRTFGRFRVSQLCTPAVAGPGQDG